LIFTVFVLCSVGKTSQAVTADHSLPTTDQIQLFTAPDESSTVVATLKSSDEISPLADILVGESTRWYLVKAKKGTVGWIKQSDTEQSRKLEKFFKALPSEPSLSITIAPSSPSGSSTRNAITVPVAMNGSSVVVPVMLNGVLSAKLALDTGATITVVSRRIASSLALSPLGASRVGTVGGVVTLPLARLRSLKVGDAEVQDLVVSIHDFSPDPRIEGLLGLDFLKNFHVSLDVRRSLLVLGPR
jgi:predicted aspartyl protease/SH3-like domain-containing protein